MWPCVVCPTSWKPWWTWWLENLEFDPSVDSSPPQCPSPTEENQPSQNPKCGVWGQPVTGFTQPEAQLPCSDGPCDYTGRCRMNAKDQLAPGRGWPCLLSALGAGVCWLPGVLSQSLYCVSGDNLFLNIWNKRAWAIVVFCFCLPVRFMRLKDSPQ